jgi:hypothetical protein
MVDIAMNRAVHLAQRDAHYKLYMSLLKKCIEISSVKRRRCRIQTLLNHIKEAYFEGLYAMRGCRVSRTEKYFNRYLELVYDAAKAAEVMVEHEVLLREDKSFLPRFLKVDDGGLARFEERHRAMVKELLQGMADMARRATPVCRKLVESNFGALKSSDLRRYKTAYQAVIHYGGSL